MYQSIPKPPIPPPPRATPGHLTRVKLHTVGNLTQNEARPVGHLTFLSKRLSAVGPLIHDKMYVSLRWSVVLSARAQIQMDQSQSRVKPPCERPLPSARSQASEESRRGEFEVKVFVLHESFGRRSTRIWSEIYWAFWNCCFYCDSGLFLLRRKRFVE